MIESEPLISIDSVGKRFCKDFKTSLRYGVSDILRDVTGRSQERAKARAKEFHAVNDVTFDVHRGDCVGLLGRNGAGKTTLLKLINGLIKPDAGSITVRGRVNALIALGAGFNPVLTGRENIYVNGSILGLSRREIENKLEEIIDFSEIREFIDSPVQSYSSGMIVRLGFSVATALEPDVLLLDEVLAVGDAAFRAKCLNRMRQITRQTATLFVSHHIGQISMICNKVAYLERGKLRFYGDVFEGIEAYNHANEEGLKAISRETISEDLVSVSVKSSSDLVRKMTKLELSIAIESRSHHDNLHLRFVVFDEEQTGLADWSSVRSGITVGLKPGINQYLLTCGPMALKPGRYRLSMIIEDIEGIRQLYHGHCIEEFRVEGSILGGYYFHMDDFEFTK